jgi:hypothetical protein
MNTNKIKKPPDKYKSIKIPLQRILKNTEQKTIIDDAALRTHKIIVKSYQLVRLWILFKYHNGDKIPTINKNTFSSAFRAIKKKTRGKESSLMKEFEQLYSFDKEDASQLTQILEQYASAEMVTAFENNIKLHFFDYVRRYVNSYWKNAFKEDLEKKKMTRKDFYKELKILKMDIFENTKNSDPKYHAWLDENRFNIVPKEYKESYHYDLVVHPQKYLKNMIWMNCQLEKINGKMFQFFPLRSNVVQGFFHMDNTTIINLLMREEYKKNITGMKEQLWKLCFKTHIINKIKIKDYSFDYGFMTDGYNASLRFIHIDEYIIQAGLQESKRKGRQNTKGLSKKERKERRTKVEKEYELKKEKDSLKQLAKTEKTEKTEKKKLGKAKKKKIEEFPYIDEVDIELLKNSDYVVVDPGKRDLMAMMNNKGEKLTYSNSRRVHETKRIKYQKLIHNHRSKLGILRIEKKLNGLNCKTCDIEIFKEYINTKNKVNTELYPLYENEKFRQYKWYSHINRKRCEDNMLNLIEEKFGKDVNIIYGDWSQGKQMRYFMSTPNLGIKRKLTERFNVYNIDEYRTSALHFRTEKRTTKLKLQDKKGKLREKHAILTYKMKNTCLGCINRDINACKNMIKIVEHFFESNGERLINFSRSVKTPDHSLKDSNLIGRLYPNRARSSAVKLVNSTIQTPVEECIETMKVISS